ncbi:MAG: hypothetical protein EA352_09125 [Gemmatimonadales bacterium]|nr:MAG: hypothetical protein EA352_09125 [Gemmatimonadales bacterium]
MGGIAGAGVAAGILLTLGQPPWSAGPGGSLPGLGLGAVTLGLALLARAFASTDSPRDAALLGAAALGSYSLLALHWIPAAAAPYAPAPAALVAGVSIWGLHAGTGAVVFALLRQALGTSLDVHPLLPLGMGGAWALLEWAPGALPVVGVPLPSVTFALVEAGGPFGLLPSGAGQVGVAGAWALMAAIPGTLGMGGADGGRRATRPGRSTGHRDMPARRAVLFGAAGLAVWALAFLPGPGADAPREGTRVVLAGWDRPPEVVGDDSAAAREVEHLMEAVEGLRGGSPVLWPEAPAGASNPELGVAWVRAALGASPGGLAGTVRSASGAGPVGNVLVAAGKARGVKGTEAAGGPLESATEDGIREVHRKRHLVPGVERTRFIRAGLREGYGLAPGGAPEVFSWAGGRQAGAMICFEVLHPAGMYGLRRGGADLLVQATNDSMLRARGLFPVVGDAARRQHVVAVRLRAVELRLPVVRSAISGALGGWDAVGRALPELQLREVVPGGGGPILRLVEVEVPPASPHRPASVWLGPLWGPMAALLLLVGAGVRHRREGGGRGFGVGHAEGRAGGGTG